MERREDVHRRLARKMGQALDALIPAAEQALDLGCHPGYHSTDGEADEESVRTLCGVAGALMARAGVNFEILGILLRSDLRHDTWTPSYAAALDEIYAAASDEYAAAGGRPGDLLAWTVCNFATAGLAAPTADELQAFRSPRSGSPGTRR